MGDVAIQTFGVGTAIQDSVAPPIESPDRQVVCTGDLPSCIEVTTVRLVTLAVLQLWRETVETGDLDAREGRNPP